jgi:hypothetical protein
LPIQETQIDIVLSRRSVTPMRRIHLIAALSVLVLGASPALADRGGHGHSTALPGASCSVSGDVVTAVGLPTDQVINFLITDDAGTWGWVLGSERLDDVPVRQSHLGPEWQQVRRLRELLTPKGRGPGVAGASR